MPILPWRTDADGFIFRNNWVFDATERAALTGLTAPAVAAVIPIVAAINPLILTDPVLMAALAAAAATYTTLGPLPMFGMCGGMAWSSLDHWIVKVSLPNGATIGGQPQHTPAVQSAVRNMIWQRLLNSLTTGGALNRTLEWSLVLNQVPGALGGGTGALVNRTAVEWVKVKARIDSGVPCPIGLVYAGRNVWDQHQILVYGYDDLGHGGRLYVYDSNAPHGFGFTGHMDPKADIVSFDLSGSTLNATSPSDFGDSLAGFFCTNYAPATPPPGLAPSFGEFISWVNDTRPWMTAYGALLPIASAAELAALGGSPGGVMPTTNAAPTVFVRPRDGALLRERSSAPVFLYQGGGPFLVPDPAQLANFGGFPAVRVVSDGTLHTFLGPAADGTLVREFSSAKVFRIVAGLPTLTAMAPTADVRAVPNGAISALLLDKIGFSVPRLTIGRNATGTVYLKAPWSDSDLVVTLASAPIGYASLPATVTIPRNSLSASFTISTTSLVLPSSPWQFGVVATLGSAIVSGSLPLQIPRIVSLAVAPATITAGGSATGTVSIEIPYASDLTLTLQSFTPTFATVPATVAIPKGHTSAQFNVAAPPSQTAFPPFTVSVQANVADTSATCTVQVNPSVIMGTLKTLSLNPATVHPGGSVTATVTLESSVGTSTRVGIAALAPGGGLNSPSPYIASIPAEITIPAGQAQGTFTIQTKPGSAGTLHTAQIMATAVTVKYASLAIS